MIIKQNELIQVKKTKGLELYHEPDGIWMVIHDYRKNESHNILIPKASVYPLIRGLISWTQRFWRRKIK